MEVGGFKRFTNKLSAEGKENQSLLIILNFFYVKDYGKEVSWQRM